MAVRARARSAAVPQYTFANGSDTTHAVAPADLAKIHSFNPLFAAGVTGRGQTIALLEGSNAYSPDD
jgi:subtilase family serine protease